jgi:hypothetical protein
VCHAVPGLQASRSGIPWYSACHEYVQALRLVCNSSDGGILLVATIEAQQFVTVHGKGMGHRSRPFHDQACDDRAAASRFYVTLDTEGTMVTVTEPTLLL